MEYFKSMKDLATTKKLMGLHKVFVEQVKGAYYLNRREAMEKKDEIMSVIIDAESSDHTTLPYNANMFHTSKTAKQKVMGAKQHGFGRGIYRSMGHLPTCADTACDVLMEEIIRRLEHCKENNVKMPHTLLVQVRANPLSVVSRLSILTSLIPFQSSDRWRP
jgi:hypothetical protein